MLNSEKIIPEYAPVRLSSAQLEELDYESLDNYLYLEGTGQIGLIKPTNYEQKKTSKFRKQIGRIENMRYDTQEDFFLCPRP